MQGAECSLPSACAFLAEQVEGQPLADVFGRSHRVDCFLHLAKPAVASLHGIAGAGQEFVVQKRQRLLQVRAVELIQRLAQRLESLQSSCKCLNLANAVCVRQRRSKSRYTSSTTVRNARR